MTVPTSPATRTRRRAETPGPPRGPSVARDCSTLTLGPFRQPLKGYPVGRPPTSATELAGQLVEPLGERGQLGGRALGVRRAVVRGLGGGRHAGHRAGDVVGGAGRHRHALVDRTGRAGLYLDRRGDALLDLVHPADHLGGPP